MPIFPNRQMKGKFVFRGDNSGRKMRAERQRKNSLNPIFERISFPPKAFIPS